MHIGIFRVRQLCILAILFVSALFIYNAYMANSIDVHASVGREQNQIKGHRNESSFTVFVSGGDNIYGSNRNYLSATPIKLNLSSQICNIPKLEINGSEVAHFFIPPKPLDCDKKFMKNWVYIDYQGKISFNEERKSSNCTISYFERKDDQSNVFMKSESISPGDKMTSDFAVVYCNDGIEKWSGLLMSVSEKKEVRNRLKGISSTTNSSGLDVFFLGFDSLSHMSFRRKLPKTVKFLENVLESVILDGYNIVGDGTPQAFIPILTGKTEIELPLTRKRFYKANYVDDVYPFIWKNFSDAGYVTAYGEDAFGIGTFTYRLKGFKNQPTDHYTRTFFKEAEKNKDWNCLGSEPLHKSWFRYSREFMRVYSDLPKFLLMHQSLLSHDDINSVGVEDEDLASHLADMFNSGYFDNALIIVMADHGHRFAKLRETHQGQLEERLPFFSVSLPKKFRATDIGMKAYHNLLNNKERLSSPFDIHATLYDILYLPSELDLIQDASKRRSLSLFRPIPENRTCDQAGIEPHWCTCLNWQDAFTEPEDRSVSLQLAHTVVNVINDQLKNVMDLCAPISLRELVAAKRLIPNTGLLKYKNVKDNDGFVPDLSGSTTPAFAHYQLKIRTKPGTAMYEVTLFHDSVAKSVHIDLSSVSHVNKFGDDPHCIIDKNYFLATYCVCYDRV